jgi:large subunit ribosomal protein L16
MNLRKKISRSKLKIKHKKNMKIHTGLFGLKILQPVELKKNHIEAMKNLIKKTSSKKTKIYTRIQFNKTKTKKPEKVRMGKGKGAIDHYVSQIYTGQIFLELSNIDYKNAFNCYKKIKKKFQIKLKLIKL